jgi:hypothetical protein
LRAREWDCKQGKRNDCGDAVQHVTGHIAHFEPGPFNA